MAHAYFTRLATTKLRQRRARILAPLAFLFEVEVKDGQAFHDSSNVHVLVGGHLLRCCSFFSIVVGVVVVVFVTVAVDHLPRRRCYHSTYCP